MANDKDPAPKVLISHSWEDVTHRDWVKQLADRLRRDGLDVKLDSQTSLDASLNLVLGPAVDGMDFLLAICTPKFRMELDMDNGSYFHQVAYLKELVRDSNIIPILAVGNWSESTPAWLRDKVGIDLSGWPHSQSE